MGLAVARRIGVGSHIIIADFSEVQLEKAVKALSEEGLQVEGVKTDVSQFKSVQNLAQHASRIGAIRVIAHTAGLGPAQAPASKIFPVNILGTANVINAFYEVATAGTSLVAVASLSGHGDQGALSDEFERHLAFAPADQLLARAELDLSLYGEDDSTKRYLAYAISKRSNIIRVQAAAQLWGRKGARINSISPGVIATPMSALELNGPKAADINGWLRISPAGRIGTPSDVANAVAFLSSAEADFIHGNDLLVDGGAASSLKWHGMS